MMRSWLRWLIVFQCFGILLTTCIQAQNLLTTNDLREQVDLSGLELSPDGRHILVLATRLS